MKTTLDDFLRALAPDAPRSAVAFLRGHLSRFDAGSTLGDRLDWLEELADWLFDGGRIPASKETPGEPPVVRRLRLLTRTCEAIPEAGAIAGAAIRSILGETNAVRLLTETGLPGLHGFLGELTRRAVGVFLPIPRTDGELADLFPRVFASDRRTRAMASAPRGLLLALAARIAEGSDPERAFPSLETAALDAMELLTRRIAVTGLAADVRARGPQTTVQESPFRRLETLFRELVDARRAGDQATADDTGARVATLRECRAFLREVLSNLDRSGVSVELVYRVDLANQSLLRLERLSAALSAKESERARAAVDLFISLLRDASQDRSVRSLVSANLRQLSRKIVERAGQTGEHYITSSRAEWRAMVGSAAGGGLLTVGTTIAKFKVYALHLPLFFDGLLAAANYGTSFVLMQLLGFTLATKQPSMTAAHLARELEEDDGDPSTPHVLGPLVDRIACISRSQLAAAFGNLLLVVFAAVLIESTLALTGREPLLDAEAASHVIASLHPFASATIPFAALTGVLLWASSIGAGWFENWATYQRIPDGIAASRRLRRMVGRVRARRLAAWIARNLSGFGGNLTLGFLLGMTPVFGKFFGLPLEVRHVTLSMGSLAFAGMRQVQPGVELRAVAWALLGIALIGFLNFGVSFAFALEVALRARNVDRTGHWQLAKAVARKLVTSPRDFVLPPPESAIAPSLAPPGH